MSLRRFVFLWLAACVPLFSLAHGVDAAPGSSPLAERLAGQRFSATTPYSGSVTEEDATIVAEASANASAMQYLMRLLVSLPEVRITGTSDSPAKTPNLLALAHASAETEVLLVSRSKKNHTVTVTVCFVLPGKNRPLETLVREALIRPDRIARYEETVLRENALLNEYGKLLRQAEERGQAADAADPASATSALTREIRALKLFKKILPGWNGRWQDPAETRTALQAALQLAPDSPLLHNALGDAALQLGRSQEAVEEQTAAIKADASFARAHHSRGTAFLALGHLSSAAADFSEAIRLTPLNAAYYRDRGMARHLLGETAAMCADLYEACSLGDCEKLHWAAANAFCSAASFRQP